MKIGPGVQVGPYQVVEQVGRGGMATVFRAYQPALERMVAIKVLPDFLAEDPEFRERFRREAVAIAKLRHPGILAVFDHGEFEGQLYIVTEFVEGGTFADELGKPLDPARAIQVLETIASALDYAHQRGILHRDVKPSNILVNREGAAVLGDFGLARMMSAGERITRLDMVVGTPEYMSPEQCAGRETGAASDQYSLGVVAFEALTGHPPFHAETPAAVMLAQMQSALPMPRTVNPQLSTATEKALLRALAKTPAERFPSCGEFVRALAATSTAAATVVAAPPVKPPFQFRLQPGRLAFVAAGLVVLLVLASIGFALFATRGPNLTAATSSGAPNHGSLVYELKLDKQAWEDGVEPSPDPAGSATVGYGASSLDIHIAQSGAGMSCGFAGPSLKAYVADFQFKVDPGSDFELNWQIRGSAASENTEVDLNIQVADESATLYLSPYEGSSTTLIQATNISGMQGGRVVDLGVAVNGKTITLYVDGKKVGSATESASTGAASPGFYLDGKSGTLHVLSLRYYTVS
jgi:serine/threonine protein kinase